MLPRKSRSGGLRDVDMGEIVPSMGKKRAVHQKSRRKACIMSKANRDQRSRNEYSVLGKEGRKEIP